MSTQENTAPQRSDGAVALVDTLRRIPDEARDFDVAADVAARTYGVAVAVLEDVVAAGLPHAGTAAAPRFERSDLINLSLQLRTGSLSRGLTRFWPRALRRLDGAEVNTCTLTYRVVCPSPGHDGPCRFALHTPEGTVERTVDAGESQDVYETEVVLPNRWPELPERAMPLVDAMVGFEFTWLPQRIRWDTDFMRASGLADCVGGSQLVVEQGRQLGLTMRSSYGLMVAAPFAARHYWAEIEVEGRWTPVDPLLLNAMTRWGVLDPRRWPPHRSLGGLLYRLAETKVPLARHDETEATVSFPTRQAPTPSNEASRSC